MRTRTVLNLFPAGLILLVAALACSLPGQLAAPATVEPAPLLPGPVAEAPLATEAPILPTAIPTVTHIKVPGEPSSGKTVYDVESQTTAAERRAPYGDSYDINRLERPFMRDMTYVSDLDIFLYKVSSDAEWWYVQVELMGTNPNNTMGINYGVELDIDHDGFGDYLILAHPTYTNTWDTLPVQVFQDKNHNTGGLSGEKSDAPITTDGYETLIFDGGPTDADPDMAWVRLTVDGVQFAFKKSWAGAVFMLGVFADAGLKDPKQLDYVDRFEEPEAGSPVRDKKYYPLGALHLVDNVCREAFGFNETGYEPQLCPREAPAPGPRPKKTPSGCERPPSCSEELGYSWFGDPYCFCQSPIK